MSRGYKVHAHISFFTRFQTWHVNLSTRCWNASPLKLQLQKNVTISTNIIKSFILYWELIISQSYSIIITHNEFNFEGDQSTDWEQSNNFKHWTESQLILQRFLKLNLYFSYTQIIVSNEVKLNSLKLLPQTQYWPKLTKTLSSNIPRI